MGLARTIESVESQPHYPRHISSGRELFDQGAITSDVFHHKYPGSGIESDPYVVSWLPNDPRDPVHYTASKKIIITIIVSITTLCIALAGTVYPGSAGDIMEEFQVSTEVTTLGLSLFTFGFACGPFFWAPLSEFIGRQYPFITSMSSMVAALAGCAGARNIETLLVLRFLAGTAGSSMLTNAGGIISDIFETKHRGIALNLFAIGPLIAPNIGSFIGGFLTMRAGWRWVAGFLAILCGFWCLLMAFTVPETYGPVLLRRRAMRLSQITGEVYQSKLDVEGDGVLPLKRMLAIALVRPWILLFREPIVFVLSIYMAIIFGSEFLMIAALPIVYQQGRGWNPGVGGLAFLGMTVGMIFAVFYTIMDDARYRRLVQKYEGHVPPEARLPLVMVSAICLPVGFFWFAWTNSPSIHWMASIAALVPLGGGIALLYFGVVTYLFDAYTIYGASALAANSILRSVLSAVFPLFTSSMYDALGIHWASSIPAFFALACVPFPFILYRYGHIIRKRCPYSAKSELYMQKLRETARE
ncbi:major facilitator superfamily domain-containing protein [Aspergillus avenaceus]|uniref:Major facilitator superfamily domain-containing protein n=1 Tax=Aspergillus avenaceus TaxID=36643 RepID=A0A5N6U164_ASPAV|nr:major facilitator superfamily domain-containing protein [Aspergillus avenaceus]